MTSENGNAELETEGKGRGEGRGAFIVLEGLDRSGKTTQAELLAERLRREGRRVEVLRFPDRTTPTGAIINAYLKGEISLPPQTISLLFSANRWEKAESILSLLTTSTTLISDRYYLSGLAYSTSKRPSLPFSFAFSPEIGLPKPDVTVFLDVEVGEVEGRGGFGQEVGEEVGVQARVREVFLREEESGRVVRVSGVGSVEEVGGRVWGVVEGVVGGGLGDVGRVGS